MDETINQRIARCRKLANLTQTEAAEKMGMKCSTYSQMERKGSISTERLLILANIFDVHPDVLLYGKDFDEPESGSLDFSSNAPARRYLMQNSNFLNSGEDTTHFIASRKEENIIKIIRNLPKSTRDDIIAYVEQKYKESK